eukprot:5226951-Pyramimonas_sp.AAC.1
MPFHRRLLSRAGKNSKHVGQVSQGRPPPRQSLRALAKLRFASVRARKDNAFLAILQEKD